MTDCQATRHNTATAYSKHGCRCPEARRRSSHQRRERRLKVAHETAERTAAAFPTFALHPDRACADVDDPDVFFPLAGNAAETRRAIAICRPCPVRTACGQWALDTAQEHGIFGGLTPRRRMKAIRDRKKATA